MNSLIILYTIKQNKNRLSWDEYFISIAFLIGSRSPSDRLHVGSVIVKDNRIISADIMAFLQSSSCVNC